MVKKNQYNSNYLRYMQKKTKVEKLVPKEKYMKEDAEPRVSPIINPKDTKKIQVQQLAIKRRI